MLRQNPQQSFVIVGPGEKLIEIVFQISSIHGTEAVQRPAVPLFLRRGAEILIAMRIEKPQELDEPFRWRRNVHLESSPLLGSIFIHRICRSYPISVLGTRIAAQYNANGIGRSKTITGVERRRENDLAPRRIAKASHNDGVFISEITRSRPVYRIPIQPKRLINKVVCIAGRNEGSINNLLSCKKRCDISGGRWNTIESFRQQFIVGPRNMRFDMSAIAIFVRNIDPIFPATNAQPASMSD